MKKILVLTASCIFSTSNIFSIIEDFFPDIIGDTIDNIETAAAAAEDVADLAFGEEFVKRGGEIKREPGGNIIININNTNKTHIIQNTKNVTNIQIGAGGPIVPIPRQGETVKVLPLNQRT